VINRSDFIYHRNRYSGAVQPENLVFNANLQEFAQKVGYISSLETAGKLSPEEAYRQIKALWRELKSSKKQLGIGQKPFELEE
jgi:isopropylmalate/homocitrate/citramalate synthase